MTIPGKISHSVNHDVHNRQAARVSLYSADHITAVFKQASAAWLEYYVSWRKVHFATRKSENYPCEKPARSSLNYSWIRWMSDHPEVLPGTSMTSAINFDAGSSVEWTILVDPDRDQAWCFDLWQMKSFKSEQINILFQVLQHAKQEVHSTEGKPINITKNIGILV